MIKLQVFGSPSLFAEDGRRLDGIVRQTKRFALLLYLACSEDRMPRRRDDLLATFWPEADKARGMNALRQALHVIRRELGAEVITGSGSQEVSMDWRLVSVDVDSFREAIHGGFYEAALRFYRGDFLAGFHVSDAPGFAFWAEEVRARLRDVASRAAEGLAREAEDGQDLSDALFWWRRTLALNPFDEAALRRIVTLLATSGNRGAALAEFERFRRRADVEFDLELSPATLALVADVAERATGGVPQWLQERREDRRPAPWAHLRRAADPVHG